MNKIAKNMVFSLAMSLFLTPICAASMPIGDFYVDAANGSDENDGLTAETAFATLGAALNLAYDMTIVVNDGSYQCDGWEAHDVRLVSVNGPDATSIKGLGVYWRSEPDEVLGVGVPDDTSAYGRSRAELRSIEDVKVEGFTIVDSELYGGTFTNCVFRDSELRHGRAYDSRFIGSDESDPNPYFSEGVYQSLLVNCVISNVQSYCCASSSLLVNCLAVGNSVEKSEWSEYSLAESSTLNQCTVVGNANRLMLRCECVNSVVYGNDADYSRLEQYEREYGQPYGSTSGFAWKSIFVRCCTDIDHAYYPRDYFDAGSSNIIDPPMFVDGYRLSTNSPCVDAAVELELYGRLPYDEERFLGGSLFGYQLETDLDGQPRTFGKASDIGAYELQTTAATNIPRSYVVTFEPDEYLAYGCCALTNVTPRVLQIVPAGGSAYWPWIIPEPLVLMYGSYSGAGMSWMWNLHPDADYSNVQSNLIVRVDLGDVESEPSYIQNAPEVNILGVRTNGQSYVIYGSYCSSREITIECYSCHTDAYGQYDFGELLSNYCHADYWIGSSDEWFSYRDQYALCVYGRETCYYLPPSVRSYMYGDQTVEQELAYTTGGCGVFVPAASNGTWSIELPCPPKDMGVRILPFNWDARCFCMDDSDPNYEPYPEQLKISYFGGVRTDDQVVPVPYIPYTYACQYLNGDGVMVDLRTDQTRIVEIGGYYPSVDVDEYQRPGNSFGWNVVWMKAPAEICEFYGDDGSLVQVVTQHSVEFDLDGKADCLDEKLLSQSVRSFTGAVEPPVKAHEGWKFLRWNCDFTCVTSNLTVVAEYLRLSNTVSFAIGPHGRSADSDLVRQLVDWGACAVAPSVAPDPGWRFVGWDGDVAQPITNATAFAAQYEPIVYGVRYEDTQGVANGNPLTYTVEDAVTFAALPDLPTLRFAGWTPAGIDRGTTGDVVVSANWARIEHPAPWREADIVAQADTMIVYAIVSNRQTRTRVEAEGSLLAAFAANGELRGVTEIYHSDTRGWRYQLSVGVTSVEEKDITLKVWDASTGRIADVLETVDCNPDMQIGTFKNPRVYLIGTVESKVLLREGWNWISPVVELDAPTIDRALSGIAFAEDDVIKSSDKTATFCDGQWNPSAFRIEPGAAYMISKSTGGAEELVFVGGDASPAVGVKSGWNWIGTTLSATQRISSVTHSVGFAEDDVFKSVSKLTTYCDDAWQPSSYEVVPGAGYKARFANAGTLSFAPQAFADADALPAKRTLLAAGRILRTSGADRAPWSPDDIVRQEDTMVVYLRVSNVVQKTSFDAEGSVVAAFAKNGECRGCTAIEDGPRGKLYQLSVGVASAYEDGFTLKLWDAASGKVYELEGELACNADKKIGAYKQPYVMHVVAEQPIPPLPENPTAEDVREALDGSSDCRLQERITNPEEYGAYRAWAETVKAPGSQTAAGAQAVKDSPNAWLSFALDSATLIPAPLADGGLKIDRFERAATAGVFDFTVSVKDIPVGDDARQGNLSKVFGIEGGASLEAMSSENVNLEFGPPENGKVRFKAGPKDEKAPAFFMRVMVLP